MKLIRKLFNRFILVAFAIFVQVGAFVFLYYFAQNYLWAIQLVASTIAVILFCVVVSKKEPPEFKIPWITFLLFLPGFGIILFVLFYPRRVRKKEKERIIYAHNQCIAYAKISDIEAIKFKNYTMDYSPVFDYLRGVSHLTVRWEMMLNTTQTAKISLRILLKT